MADSESEIASNLLDLSDSEKNNSGDEASSDSKVPTNSNNNWKGINQYKNTPRIGDQRVGDALREYHRRNITNKDMISKLLKADHGITLSASSVTRHKSFWGLKGSKVTTATMAELEKRQAVFDEMANDPNGKQGPRTMKERIALNQEVHLTRKYVEETMRAQDPEGFRSRDPVSKKIKRGVLVCLGPHHEWSADGHDKLASIGFPIWGVCDVYSGRWLGLWVVPNNRIKEAIAYIYLKLVRKYGGMPIQMTTDCGSEVVMVYGFANALREEFAADLAIDVLPAHRFLQSIYNITIERGWLRLRLEWGDNVKVFWDAGSTVYNSSDPKQHELVCWLWPTIIQAELDKLRDTFNNHRVRKDRGKLLPSGVSPNVAFSLYKEYGGDNGLIPVDCNVIEKLMESLGGEDLIRFVSLEYAAKAQAVFELVGAPQLSMSNVWDVFQAMLPLM